MGLLKALSSIGTGNADDPLNGKLYDGGSSGELAGVIVKDAHGTRFKRVANATSSLPDCYIPALDAYFQNTSIRYSEPGRLAVDGSPPLLQMAKISLNCEDYLNVTDGKPIAYFVSGNGTVGTAELDSPEFIQVMLNTTFEDIPTVRNLKIQRKKATPVSTNTPTPTPSVTPVISLTSSDLPSSMTPIGTLTSTGFVPYTPTPSHAGSTAYIPATPPVEGLPTPPQLGAIVQRNGILTYVALGMGSLALGTMFVRWAYQKCVDAKNWYSRPAVVQDFNEAEMVQANSTRAPSTTSIFHNHSVVVPWVVGDDDRVSEPEEEAIPTAQLATTVVEVENSNEQSTESNA